MTEYLQSNPPLPKSNDIMERQRNSVIRNQAENKYLKNVSPTFQTVITHEYGEDKSEVSQKSQKQKIDPCYREKPELNKKGKGHFNNYGHRHFSDVIMEGKKYNAFNNRKVGAPIIIEREESKLKKLSQTRNPIIDGEEQKEKRVRISQPQLSVNFQSTFEKVQNPEPEKRFSAFQVATSAKKQSSSVFNTTSPIKTEKRLSKAVKKSTQYTGGEAKSMLNYDFALPYRDIKITGKCNVQPYDPSKSNVFTSTGFNFKRKHIPFD